MKRITIGGDPLWFRVFTHAVLIVACVIALFPILRIVSVSLRPGDRLLSTSLRIIPEGATLENYYNVLFKKDFFLWLWNSLVVSVTTAFIGLMLASTAAYGFSRWNFPGKKAGLVFLLATQMIPASMMMIPLYILAARLGFINTYRGLVLAYSVGSIPFSVWILKGYYDSISASLEEAAMIDGATRMQTFYRIILPLSLPGLSIAFLFNFMSAWKDFLLARIMLQKDFLFTWPLGLQQLQGQFRTSWGMFAAASIMVAIPVVALFLYTSRYLISGLTLGSVKGD
ncbi:transporter [Spirochaeta thermophila DSM 6192]|uniref:Maltose/maltodextrin transport system permease protein MalG n=2 Tax=Winmispira thermophila TaxID=154 RepID=E0RSH7_WINT6|nr:transporter [Spirochaeta thermophila DSM 6192]